MRLCMAVAVVRRVLISLNRGSSGRIGLLYRTKFLCISTVVAALVTFPASDVSWNMALILMGLWACVLEMLRLCRSMILL